MKTRLLSTLALLVLIPTLRAADEKAKNCGCDCCQGAATCCCAAPAAADQPVAPVEEIKSHPLKGVIMGINAEKVSLLVKHEEIPGVMRAMTMMFKVDPTVLDQVKRGDAITARMSRRPDGWWLSDVAIAK